MQELSTEQKKASEHIDGPFLCIAGPGSGKTFTLVRRVLYMVMHGVQPDSILVMTFTRNAAMEMKERYEALPGAVIGPSFSTIHSFAFAVLRKYGGYSKDDIFDPGKQKKYFRSIFMQEEQDGNISKRDIQNAVRNLISDISAYHATSDRQHFEPKSFRDKSTFLRYYHQYERYKNQNHLIDFDDMLYECREVMKDPKVLDALRNKYRYIMVDEFQDTSFVQAEILYSLAAPLNNIFATGDDDQSIYAFRNARPDIMLDFPKRFAGCGVAYLTKNYRSEKAVIETAGHLIEENKIRFDKKIKGNKKKNGSVKTVKCKTRKDQNEKIIELVEKEALSVPRNEIAVLCRTNLEVSMIAKAFSDKGIPFYSPEILDNIHDNWLFRVLLTYLKVAYNKVTLEEVTQIVNKPSRFIPRNIIQASGGNPVKMLNLALGNKKTERQVKKLISDLRACQSFVQPGSTIGAILSRISLYLRFDAYIKEYCTFAALDADYYEDILGLIIEEAADFTDFTSYLNYIEGKDKEFQAKRSGNFDGTFLSTIHRAKGLEWDDVIIPSCSGGNIPYIPKRETINSINMEEERRLFYVAITRARQKCTMLWTTDKPMSQYISEAIGKAQ